MAIWVTSDIHFGHLNILKYCPDRSGGREVSWDTVALMNEKIITNWNSIVKFDDEIYVLGDCCMGQVEKTHKHIERLNGKKYLIRGNHDKTLTKIQEDGSRYSDGLFEWVKDVHEMGYKTEDGKKVSLFMSHYPHHSWNGMGNGSVHFHGHLHGSPCNVTGRIFDVGIDTNNLCPYSMEHLVQRMLKIEVTRSHHDN